MCPPLESCPLIKNDLSIGFIGVGVLGKGLPLALAAQGYRVVSAYSRRVSSAQWLASRIPGCVAVESAQELADSVDLVFITTPDSVIRDVAAALRWRPNQGAIHCCGAASTELLEAAAAKPSFATLSRVARVKG